MELNIVELNAKSVCDLWNNRNELFTENTIDLNKIKKVDSAGIAFLVLWAKSTSSGKLSLISAPESAINLIKLFKLENMFELSCNGK